MIHQGEGLTFRRTITVDDKYVSNLAVAAWPTGRLGFLALGLACVGLAGAR